MKKKLRKNSRKNLGNKLLILALAGSLAVAALFTGCAREMTEEQSAALVALQSAVTYYETNDNLKDWEDLAALAAANRADGIGINWNALKLPDTKRVTNSQGSRPSATDYTGGIISSILKGEDSSQMVEELKAMQDPETGAFNAAYPSQQAWAMITLNVAAGRDGYDYDKAAAFLLSFQKEDGGLGFSLESPESDVDLTGIASVALAPYYSKHKKSAEMKALLSFYKERQAKTGGYEGNNGETPSTIAYAIWGLTALDRPLPTTEEGLSPVDALLAYQNEDGSFRNKLDGDRSFDAPSTRQAVIALCDVVNHMNTYVLLAEDAESYRIQNISGPAITLSIDYPQEAGRADVNEPFTVEEGSSPVDAIVLYGKITEIPVVVKKNGNGGRIQSINGVEEKSQGEDSGWVYRINGEAPQAASPPAILGQGDSLSWVFVQNVSQTIME